MALPSNVSTSLTELALLADEIWYLAGDSGVDSSWYTKRATLSAIYSGTEMFMTTDDSPDFIETENFLDRRLDDFKALGFNVGGFSQWARFSAQSAVNVLRSKGVKI
ncbi:MAG: Ubiquinone biosynthesis protein coq9, mitochondrial [Stictis urceolatum]|nr:Ubiquinone biosynthesis protein coq9, mitochondrial [Stictis urceolata]